MKVQQLSITKGLPQEFAEKVNRLINEFEEDKNKFKWDYEYELKPFSKGYIFTIVNSNGGVWVRSFDNFPYYFSPSMIRTVNELNEKGGF